MSCPRLGELTFASGKAKSQEGKFTQARLPNAGCYYYCQSMLQYDVRAILETSIYQPRLHHTCYQPGIHGSSQLSLLRTSSNLGFCLSDKLFRYVVPYDRTPWYE